jgi:hypothetical protein
MIKILGLWLDVWLPSGRITSGNVHLTSRERHDHGLAERICIVSSRESLYAYLQHELPRSPVDVLRFTCTFGLFPVYACITYPVTVATRTGGNGSAGAGEEHYNEPRW